MDYTLILNWLIDVTLKGSLLALVIMGLKFLLKDRVSPKWHYYIWGLLLIRLLVPVAPESVVSVFNIVNNDINNVAEITSIDGESVLITDEANGGIIEPVAVKAVSEGNQNTYNESEMIANEDYSSQLEDANEVNSARTPITEIVGEWLSYLNPNKAMPIVLIWILGMVIAFSILVKRNLQTWHYIKSNRKLNNQDYVQVLEKAKTLLKTTKEIKVYEVRGLNSPALLGLINPSVMLPETIKGKLTEKELEYIFVHELTHMKKHDLVGYLMISIAQCIHWFNPLVWYSGYLMRKDCELSCDYDVLKVMDAEEHRDYGMTLIKMAVKNNEKLRAANMLCMSSEKSQIKNRIKNISLFKKVSWKISVLSVIIIIAIGATLLTNGKRNGIENEGSYEGEKSETVSSAEKNDEIEELENDRNSFGIISVKPSYVTGGKNVIEGNKSLGVPWFSDGVLFPQSMEMVASADSAMVGKSTYENYRIEILNNENETGKPLINMSFDQLIGKYIQSWDTFINMQFNARIDFIKEEVFEERFPSVVEMNMVGYEENEEILSLVQLHQYEVEDLSHLNDVKDVSTVNLVSLSYYGENQENESLYVEVMQLRKDRGLDYIDKLNNVDIEKGFQFDGLDYHTILIKGKPHGYIAIEGDYAVKLTPNQNSLLSGKVTIAPDFEESDVANFVMESNIRASLESMIKRNDEVKANSRIAGLIVNPSSKQLEEKDASLVRNGPEGGSKGTFLMSQVFVSKRGLEKNSNNYVVSSRSDSKTHETIRVDRSTVEKFEGLFSDIIKVESNKFNKDIDILTNVYKEFPGGFDPETGFNDLEDKLNADDGTLDYYSFYGHDENGNTLLAEIQYTANLTSLNAASGYSKMGLEDFMRIEGIDYKKFTYNGFVHGIYGEKDGFLIKIRLGQDLYYSDMIRYYPDFDPADLEEVAQEINVAEVLESIQAHNKRVEAQNVPLE